MDSSFRWNDIVGEGFADLILSPGFVIRASCNSETPWTYEIYRAGRCAIS